MEDVKKVTKKVKVKFNANHLEYKDELFFNYDYGLLSNGEIKTTTDNGVVKTKKIGVYDLNPNYYKAYKADAVVEIDEDLYQKLKNIKCMVNNPVEGNLSENYEQLLALTPKNLKNDIIKQKAEYLQARYEKPLIELAS